MSAVQVKLSTDPSFMPASPKPSKNGDRSFSDILVSKEKPLEKGGENRKDKNNMEEGKPLTMTKEKPTDLKRKDGKNGSFSEDKVSYGEEDDLSAKAEKDDGADENKEALIGFLNGLISDLALKIGADEEKVKDFLTLTVESTGELPDIDSWKEFVVMNNELGGTSEILTDEKAFKEFEVISDLLRQNADSEEMKQLTAGLTEDGFDLKELLQKTDEIPEEALKSEAGMGIDLLKEGTTEDIVNAETPKEGEENPQTKTSEGERGDVKPTGRGAVHEGLFDRLVSEVKELTGSEKLPEGITAKEIIEQVTSEIKSLHAPDKMTLELMLQPATLGKVLIQVTSKNGMMQAEIKVENEAAKTVLENSIADLKLNFENDGFKVENVEITLADTGIGDQNRESREGEEGKKNKNKGNKKIDLSAVFEPQSTGEQESGAIPSLGENGSGESVDYSA